MFLLINRPSKWGAISYGICQGIIHSSEFLRLTMWIECLAHLVCYRCSEIPCSIWYLYLFIVNYHINCKNQWLWLCLSFQTNETRRNWLLPQSSLYLGKSELHVITKKNLSCKLLYNMVKSKPWYQNMFLCMSLGFGLFFILVLCAFLN